ncbi:MAG: sodium-dependent transporter [Balneolaceae bacterium]|nr:MAG: sodium-dependent transporter [Balneolaceae bacterium]
MRGTDITRPVFKSRLGLILSVLGIAVGTGNIWRFPRIAAQNGTDDGAGAFIIAWVIALFMWSIPLIIAEYAIGRAARRGTIGAFVKLIGEKFAWMGAFIGFVATAIMFYYSVVTGWCIYYFLTTASNPLPGDVAGAMMIWDSFQGSMLPSLFHFIAIAVAGFIVINGIRAIERVNMILIPTLLLILLVSGIRAITLPGSYEGIAYLFTPDWSSLGQPTVWLEALTQNAWDTGAGWGLILTYAVYMRRNDGVVKSAFQTGIGNNMVSLWAAITIFATVFAILGAQQMTNPEILEVMKTSGPASTGLTFIWMPQLFLEIPGGRAFAIMFFLALTFAAFSSLISMIELATKLFVDMGISRRLATIIICSTGFIMGLPSAMSLEFFANQDFVWGLGLMISGSFIAYCLIKYDVMEFRTKLINVTDQDIRLNRVFDFIIKYVIPVEVVILLGWWILRSAFEFAPDSWYNPFNPYSVATCFVQWGIVMGLFLMYNRKLATLSMKGP